MKRWTAFLIAAIVGAASSQRPANATEIPSQNHYDSRMRVVAYNPNQIVHLSTTVGSMMVISFGQDEVVNAVAAADTLDLGASPRGNYLFLKPKKALALEPVVVLTALPGGHLRRYVFEFETVADPTTANGADGVYYSVQFRYPIEAARAAAARAQLEAEKTARLNAQEALKAQQIETKDLLNAERTDPYAGPRNYHYVAQGNRSLEPTSIWDNGYSTVMTLPGNTAVPSVFVINPDGKEATASYSVHGNIIEIAQTAKEFRLRYGGTVLNIYNLGYNTVGQNPGTGTVSPSVSRVVATTNKAGAAR